MRQITARIMALAILACCAPSPLAADPAGGGASPSSLGDYVVLGWNDLGMHCMGKDYSAICILPPFNDIEVHLIRRGSRPQVTTQGVELSYRIQGNTYSQGKINFWTYANHIFGVTLPTDIGLTGRGLSGTMTGGATGFIADGVPLAPYDDATPTVDQPYQLAEVTARDTASSTILDQTVFVAPVSVEMHCDQCHVASGGYNTYERILRLHDNENGTTLYANRPVLCANCHASVPLNKPGVPGLPSLSLALHKKHGEEVPSTSCYTCHPGPTTQCQRGAMFIAGKTCTDCHGTLRQVASSIEGGRRPWLDEPKCSTCHGANFAENTGKLYRMSTGHGGLRCEVCHNSPHAELPTVQARDGVQMLRVQGDASWLKDCRVCHIANPTAPGPHGFLPPSAVSNWRLFE